MLLRSSDGRYSVQLQNDRFAFGWHRTEPIGEPAQYDGFESHKEAWSEVLDSLEHWHTNRFNQKPKYRLVELSYSNAAPLATGDRTKKLSEIFTFIQVKSRSVIAFNTGWVESILPLAPGEPVKGTVSTQVALGTAPPAQPVLTFTFSGLAAVAEGEESEHILDLVHTKIREIYAAAIIPDGD